MFIYTFSSIACLSDDRGHKFQVFSAFFIFCVICTHWVDQITNKRNLTKINILVFKKGDGGGGGVFEMP